MSFLEMQGDPVWHGTAKLFPDRPIIAGEKGTWKIIYTVGRYGIDNGGRIKVAMRLASDWAGPQVNDPSGSDYLSVITTGKARVEAKYEWKGHLRPWFRTVTIYVSEEALEEGDQVIITFGDTSCGGPGTQAQTFSEKGFAFLVLVESFETGVFVKVSDPPKTDIVGGPVNRLVALVQSQVLVGESFWLTVKAEDAWGNPSDSFSGRVTFENLEGVE